MMVRVRAIRNGRCPLEVIDSEAEAETEDDTMEGFEDAEEPTLNRSRWGFARVSPSEGYWPAWYRLAW